MTYEAAMGPEYDLGVDDGKSTYWPGSPLPDPPESPIEIHNYAYHDYIGRDNEAEEIMIVKWTTGIEVKRMAVFTWMYIEELVLV